MPSYELDPPSADAATSSGIDEELHSEYDLARSSWPWGLTEEGGRRAGHRRSVEEAAMVVSGGKGNSVVQT